MKALVTGATGFIGKHLARDLLRAGWRLSLAVRSPEKARSLGFGETVTAFKLDLGHLPDVDLWTYLGRPDVAFHLAWEGLPNYASLHHLEKNAPRQYQFLIPTPWRSR